MKIAFFTEGGYQGKVPRTHSNMRTELAWMCALNADHWNINQPPNQQYDLGVVIIPKNNPQFDINKLKQYCNKIAVMQEGPNWYWQDYPLNQQIWYYNTIQEADFMFVHNESDKRYYMGLTGKECKILPSLMIEDSIKNLSQVERKEIIIGGNFCSWYGGFDSYITAQEWIKTLNNFKYGVHMMRTHAAGTFALNCAYLGIPCIGYEGLDTQEKLYPYLTVKLGDLATAKEKLTLLKTDKEFYNKCSLTAKENYKKYNEQNFINKWKKYIQK